MDCKVASAIWRNDWDSCRCTVLAFLTLESKGERFIIIPLQCHDRGISGPSPQIDVNYLNVITLSPFDSKGGQAKTYTGPITDKDCSIKSAIARTISRVQFLDWSCIKGFDISESYCLPFSISSIKSAIARSISRPQFLDWSGIKGFVIGENNWHPFSISYFFRNPFITVEYPLVISSEFDTANSAHLYVKVSKGNKGTERKLRRKATKELAKGWECSISHDLTELTFKTGCSESQAPWAGNIDLGIKLDPHEARLVLSLPDLIGQKDQNIIIDDTLMLKTITSCSVPIVTSKVGLPHLPDEFRSEKYLSLSRNNWQTPSTEAVNSNEGTQDSLLRLIRDPGMSYTLGSDSLVLDSVPAGTILGETCAAETDLKLSDDEDAGVGIVESPPYHVKEEVSCYEDKLSRFAELCSHARSKNHVRRGTDRERNSHTLGKREKHFRKAPQVTNLQKFSRLANQNRYPGKENTHSIWQKVHRNDGDGCICKDNTVNSQFDNGCKQAPGRCKHQSDSNSCVLSTPEDLKKIKVSKKVKKRRKPRAKQESHCCCSNDSHAKVCSHPCSKFNLQLNRVSGAQPGRENELSEDPSSFSRTGSKIEFQSKKAESVSFIPLEKSRSSSGNLGAYESTHGAVPLPSVQSAEDHSDSLQLLYRFNDLSKVHKELGFFNHDNTKMEKEMFPGKHHKQNTGVDAVAQKCVPVGGNNSGMHDRCQSTLSVEEVKVAKEMFDSEVVGGVGLASNPSTEVNHSSQHPNWCINTIVSEDEIQVERFTESSTNEPKDFCSITARKCLICEFKEHSVSGSESDPRRFFQVVNDAYEAQLASEAIERVTGCPVAEFEKFVHAASPVISQPAQKIGASACGHETPELPLGSLWKWYEKHGACGLEVRSEDYENSNRLGMDQFVFRAYFVPYLSAVQLFRECGSHSTNNKAFGAHEKKSSESSVVGGLPSVFQMLVPQPREGNSRCSNMNRVTNSESSLLGMNGSIDLKFSDNMDLLFEYFESEQPQRRRPLFEMIKDLAGGEKPSKCRLNGDATILESVGLHDLHPNSWFSVAWYPVYRIPDGKLRVAFLTYHSLGHMVRQSPSCGSYCSVVSPVVGLQCYNAQGECWFRPRHAKEVGVPNADPSEILKERIRTLENTAAKMARAVVELGSQKSRNLQPDYEFFLSRRC